jgi:hypothetical protein
MTLAPGDVPKFGEVAERHPGAANYRSYGPQLRFGGKPLDGGG